MLKIEKTKWRPTKLSKTVYYFRPYTDITSQVSNSMRGNEEQAQNEATFTADLLAALTRESIPATPTSIPGPTLDSPNDGEVSCSSQLSGRKRQSSNVSTDELQPSSSKLKPSVAPTPEPPSFPKEVKEFVKISEHDGSTAYLKFADDYSSIRLAIVFSSPRQRECSNSDEELKWEVEYGVVLRGARVKGAAIEATDTASLHLIVEDLLKSPAELKLCVGVERSFYHPACWRHSWEFWGCSHCC